MTAGKEPSSSEILSALQGMWGQQKELILGVENRLEQKLGAKIEAEVAASETRVKVELSAVKHELGERITREINDRPVVVHVDMGRVSDLERELAALKKRMTELESRFQG